MTAVIVFVPMISLLAKEQSVLSERRFILYELHDELQPYLWDSAPTPIDYITSRDGKMITYTFTKENNYIKGCASWENARKKAETLCLYGLPEN